MPLKPARRTIDGFTLIELLVVIAIISVLAAILLPAFASAREKGRQTACASNMHQLSLALLQYVQDYDEYFPATYAHVAPIHGGNWPYMTIDAQLDPYLKNDGVWACPSASGPLYNSGQGVNYYDGAYDPSMGGHAARKTYAIMSVIITREANGRDPNTGITDGYPYPALGDPLSAVEDASGTLALGEDSDSSQVQCFLGTTSCQNVQDCNPSALPGRTVGQDAYLQPGCSPYYAQAPYRGHSGFGNYAFVDGHVKALTWPQVYHDDFTLFKRVKTSAVWTP